MAMEAVMGDAPCQSRTRPAGGLGDWAIDPRSPGDEYTAVPRASPNDLMQNQAASENDGVNQQVTGANDGVIGPAVPGLRSLAGRHDADVGQMEFRPLVRGFRRFDVHLFDQSVSDALGMVDDGVKDQLALQVVDSLVDMDD